MIENMRIPRYKISFPDSEISDGTRPVYADSKACPERFSPKENFYGDKIQCKNLYKPSIPDSEISDGTRPVYADSEARAKRFLQKSKFFTDRADKILYFPILTFGREDSDALRGFDTWGIKIYNQIKGLSILRVKNRISLQIFPILTFGRVVSDASRRFITWVIEIYNQITLNRFQVSKILVQIQETAGRATACNLALPAGGIRRPHPRLIIWGRGCGNAWSLGAIPSRNPEGLTNPIK